MKLKSRQYRFAFADVENLPIPCEDDIDAGYFGRDLSKVSIREATALPIDFGSIFKGRSEYLVQLLKNIMI